MCVTEMKREGKMWSWLRGFKKVMKVHEGCRHVHGQDKATVVSKRPEDTSGANVDLSAQLLPSQNKIGGGLQMLTSVD